MSMASPDEVMRDILAGPEGVGDPRDISRSTPEAVTSTPGRDNALFSDLIRPTRRPQVVIEDTTAEPVPVRGSATDNLLQSVSQMIQNFSAQVARMNTRREKPSRTFSGQIYENPLAFVRYMDTFFRDNDVGEDNIKSDVFRGQLRDAAKKWAQPLEGVPMSYRAFKDSFLRHFDSNTVRNEATSTLYGEKQKIGESVEVFLNKKRSLFARINPTLNEIAMAEVLKDQLIPPIKSRLRNTEFLDIAELISQAGLVEADVREEAEYWEKAAQASRRAPQPSTSSSSGTTPEKRVRFQSSLAGSGGPPSPCRFCGQWHYNNECPRNPYRNLNSARVPEERGQPMQRTETRTTACRVHPIPDEPINSRLRGPISSRLREPTRFRLLQRFTEKTSQSPTSEKGRINGRWPLHLHGPGADTGLEGRRNPDTRRNITCLLPTCGVTPDQDTDQWG